jgi:Lysozyme like domain
VAKEDILSFEQVAAVAIGGGFPPGPAVIATAITPCESGRDATIVQAGEPYATTGWGLWQITPGDSVPQYGINDALLDPLRNAKAAHYKWAQAGGFSPWTTYMDGCYTSYLHQAEIAVEQVTHISRRKLAALIASAGSGKGAGSPASADVHDWSPAVRVAAGHLAHVALAHAAGVRVLASAAPCFTVPVVSPGNPEQILLLPEDVSEVGGLASVARAGPPDHPGDTTGPRVDGTAQRVRDPLHGGLRPGQRQHPQGGG